MFKFSGLVFPVPCSRILSEFRFSVSRFSPVIVALALVAVGVRAADAVILYENGPAGSYDPNANTTAPTGALAGSGWQDEGQFGGELGTAIAPNYFITAAHIGGTVGDTFTFDGTSYTTTASYLDPGTDLRIWQVAGTLPTYAPLYNSAPGSEVNLSLVVFGNGNQRGSAYTLPNSQVGGWLWGTSGGTQRWGTSAVGAVVTAPGLGSLLQAPFLASGGFNEAQLSAGDSGGGVFIYNPNASQWQLAGINYGVDGYFSTSPTGSNPFIAALFDTTGLYEQDNNGNWVAAANPSAFYATEIAANTAFIDSVIAVPEPATWAGGILALVWIAGLAARRYGRHLRVGGYWLIGAAVTTRRVRSAYAPVWRR